MNDLNKTQLILLALLVSFVTSIATGIATVSLIEQAPPGVTQTIHKVVERTVETVVPQTASVVTTETQVIVKEEDVIPDAVSSIAPSLVRITVAHEQEESAFVGLGFVVDTTGLIATASSIVANEVVYQVHIGGETVSARAVYQNETDGIALLAVIPQETTEETNTAPSLTYQPVKTVLSDSLRLGQSVVALGGASAERVDSGIVTRLEMREVIVESEPSDSEDTQEEETKVLARIHTDIDSAVALAGAPLSNLFGEVIGMSDGIESRFIPSDIITEHLALYRTQQEQE